ncbi:hypothetical protein PRBEI_2001744400 [Prionailurus iriomotensis]
MKFQPSSSVKQKDSEGHSTPNMWINKRSSSNFTWKPRQEVKMVEVEENQTP